MLADRVHDRTDATPEELAGRIRRGILAVHAAAASHGQSTVTAAPAAPLG